MQDPPAPAWTSHTPMLQCFQHFVLYLKGREELVVTIYHGLRSPQQQPPITRVGSIG